MTTESSSSEPRTSSRCSSMELLKVRFSNRSGKSVEIFWVTYEGEYQLYATLRTGQFIDVNTYRRHVWVFKEVGTGKRVRANTKLYFYGSEECGDWTFNSRLYQRLVVILSEARVNKLEKICINIVSSHLKKCTDVKYLEIPVVLKRRLIKEMHKMYPNSHSTNDDLNTCEKNLIDFSQVA